MASHHPQPSPSQTTHLLPPKRKTNPPPPHLPKRLFPPNPEPNGWDFEDIRYMETSPPTENYYIPWKNISVMPLNATPNIPPDKFYIVRVAALSTRFHGDGIVVDGPSNHITGCYKTFKHALAEGWHTQVERTETQRRIRDLEMLVETLRADARPRKGERKKVEDELLELRRYKRRLEGLLLDPRPTSVSRHGVRVWEIHGGMRGVGLGGFGGRYGELLGVVAGGLGVEFDFEVDVPVFARGWVLGFAGGGEPERYESCEREEEEEEEVFTEEEFEEEEEDEDEDEDKADLLTINSINLRGAN